MHCTRVVGCQVVSMFADNADHGPDPGSAHEHQLTAATGVRQLLRKSFEPRRQKKELVDLMRWYPRRFALDGRINGVNEIEQARGILRRTRCRGLGPHPPATDEIDPIVSVV